MARETSHSSPAGDTGGDDTGILGHPVRRRAFLQVAGLSALGLLGARAGLATIGVASDEEPAVVGARHQDPIAELAASLEYDAERIFRFVADQIRYEPYPGILRGPVGTLVGRAGNSADQAALLAALLEASLLPVRFVHGPIDDGRADQLLAGALVDQATAQDDVERLLLGTVPRGPAPLGEPTTPDPQLRELVDRLPDIAAAARAVATRQVDEGVRSIVDALASAEIDPPMGTSAVPALEREQHVWVQMAATADWVDLDPTLPDARPGTSLTEPAGEPLAALPDELRHRIGFEVIAERITDGTLTQETVLEHSAFVDELAGVPIVLLHERPQALEALGVALAGVLTGTSVYQPILQVGDRAFVGLSSLSFGDGGGALGGLSEGDDFLAASGETTAEWLDVHLTPPRGERTTTRRTLFDRVGEAHRASGEIVPSAIAPVELVDLDEAHRSEYLPARTVRVLAVAGGPSAGDSLHGAPADETGGTLLERSAHLFHLCRDAMLADLGARHGARTFLDGPNVTAWRIGLVEPGTDVQSLTSGVDVLTRSLGQLPLVGASMGPPPGVLTGVISHVAERIAMGEGLPPDMVAEAHPVSVGGIFEAAEAQGLGVLVLRGEVPAGLPFPLEAMARLRRALGEGWVAIVPERPVPMGGVARLGWWLVEPDTGRTIDELDDGSGGVTVSYLINLAKVAFRVLASLIRLGICLLNLYLQVTQWTTGLLDVTDFLYGLLIHFLSYNFFKFACRGLSIA